MNKQELIAAIAADTKLTQAEIGRVVNSFIDTITKSMKKGNEVVITGFGKFEAKKRAAREGRNPSTGAKIKIPASKVPTFKAGKALKDAINA